ncbi:hypothetical protein BEWA_018770 [Theileria equi strain WA]|uniref:E3 ubiquitin protein ligase n=1 Tax=Theileria equi strain WA TaxID=1537102 RepID=L0ATQ9_THEEQ|nr:hypothetical protein BEWA_018770 [Theileria equi strain WA]AFZ79032.1 hypothetical protein BEWA_018770 [Theileria equi strain WA]|eukprot:XP_004828698.1 hypothetical protein BEWA_018770 [Theileria equi strain WA]
MVLKKRLRSDTSLLDEQLPLNDIELYQQNNHQLHEALEEYRKENDTLYRNNVILSRKNDCLDLLLVSISSLWDMLNSDIDKLLSQRISNYSLESSKSSDKQYDGTKLQTSSNSGFWERLIDVNFPFQLSTTDCKQLDVDLDNLSYIYDNDDCLLADVDYSGNDEEWLRVKDIFIQNKLSFFNKKKNDLLTSIKSFCLSKNNSNEDSFKTDQVIESSVDNNQCLSKTEVTQLLKFGCFNYKKLLILLNEKHKTLKEVVNNLRIENSRLDKQNSLLKFELKSCNTDSNPSPSKNITPISSIEASFDVSSTIGDSCNVKVIDNIDDVSEELIIGSSLYLKLFSHCKGLDDEISRLEKENSQLKIDISNIVRALDEKYSAFKEKYEQLSTSVLDQVEKYEILCSQKEQDLLLLKNDYSALNKNFEEKNKENEKLLIESSEKDDRIMQLTAHNTSLCRQFVQNTSTSSSHPELEDFKEQLLNISEELEMISTAFEEKKRTCDEVMRQLNDNTTNKEKIISLQTSYNTVQEKLNKIVSICDSKLSNYTQHKETLENIIQDYKDSWFHSYKRSCYLEQQRDNAYSALSEVQSQYRKSCRTQKALQNRLSLNDQSTASEMGDSLISMSDTNHVFRENEILRRRMTCTVCCESFRDHCITKCGHVFCQKCLNNSIKSRNRKCPQCKINFDKNDTQRIFLD